jgi:cytochrome c-type biogenesis protein CcmH
VSIGLVVALLAMSMLAVALLLLPLVLRRRSAEVRDAYNLAVYRDQLAEIDRDVGRGILRPGEAEAARTEIGRRILALAPATAADPPGATAPLAAATIAVVLLPLAAWGLYWQLGSPTLPDQPYAARAGNSVRPTAQADPHVDMAEALRKLDAHLQQHPDDLQGWVLLGRSQLGLSHFKEAVDAYRHAVELSGNRPEIVGDWGEAMVLAAGGTVTPQAKQAFETARADPDSAPRSRYYLALAKLQGGDAKAALQDWVDLEAVSPADAEWLPMLRERIADAAKTLGIDPATLKTSSGGPRTTAPAAAESPSPSVGAMPSGDTVAAAAKATADASPEEKRAMIESMVERLATRLQQSPDDVEGWTRLGRSYTVLNQPDKARDAYAHTASLKPDDIGLKQAYAEAIIAAAGDNAETLPAEATTLLRAVLAAEPKNEAALWYVGLAEAEAGHRDAAQDLWTRLLAQLPADAPERREVEQRLAALKPDTAK